VQFRPARTAAAPRIDGVQTAVVVAPTGYDPRTPYTDSVASARVQFHWDRAGSDDERSSCWVRCSQPSAGCGWGSIFLPLAGNEVVVAFLNGDPDQPIVVGNVYNAANPPPRKLPDDAYKTIVQDVAGNFVALDSEKRSESLTIQTAYLNQFTTMGKCSKPD
jgi:type VI secretion system secreted protein VgrG